MIRQINGYMKAVAKTYSDGDFAFLAEQDTISDEDIKGVGDYLFRFLMVELSVEEGCDSVSEARRRLSAALRDLTGAAHAVEDAFQDAEVS